MCHLVLAHGIVMGTAGLVLLFSVVGYIFWTCGDSGNPTCYGKVHPMTLTFKNLTDVSDYCKFDNGVCNFDMKYIFESDDKIIETENYDQSMCLYKYETDVAELIVGNEYLVHEFYLDFGENYWWMYGSSGVKPAIFISYVDSHKYDSDDEWANKLESCLKPPVSADYIMFIFGMVVSCLMIVIDGIVILCTVLP